MGGLLAQLLGQALASWTLVAHVADWQNASIWVAAPLLAAIVVPFRHDGTLHDRAKGNFGASLVVAGVLWWEVAIGGFDGILGGGGFSVGPIMLLMLTATVLFAVAGAFFWVLREGGSR
jgi:hypothetical protein